MIYKIILFSAINFISISSIKIGLPPCNIKKLTFGYTTRGNPHLNPINSYKIDSIYLSYKRENNQPVLSVIEFDICINRNSKTTFLFKCNSNKLSSEQAIALDEMIQKLKKGDTIIVQNIKTIPALAINRKWEIKIH